MDRLTRPVSHRPRPDGPSRRDVMLGALATVAAAALPLRASGADALAQPAQPTSFAGVRLKVMTFNIRYGTANDGENHWDKRKDFLVDVIRTEAPDILGVQEALHAQLAYILTALPEYALVGVGRDDGVAKGEYAGILYRPASVTLNRSDTFWFSDTPERVASTSWGNSITRICTWAQFTAPDGRPLYVYNLHLDHQSQPSREKSIALLRRRIEARDPKAPVIVTGDFNAGEKNPAVLAMLEGPTFRDSFRVAHADAAPVGTFTGFTLGRVQGEKIDYIFVTREWQVVDAAIVRTARNERYPSDHFPVTATLTLAER